MGYNVKCLSNLIIRFRIEMPAPKPWYLKLFDDHSIRVMYSHGEKPQEAKCPGPSGKTRGPITSISSGAELAKDGTPDHVKPGLIAVSISMHRHPYTYLSQLHTIYLKSGQIIHHNYKQKTLCVLQKLKLKMNLAKVRNSLNYHAGQVQEH